LRPRGAHRIARGAQKKRARHHGAPSLPDSNLSSKLLHKYFN
jgi:hypothetical protein